MNTQPFSDYKISSSFYSVVRFGKRATGKNSLKARHLYLISRIMVSLLITGLMGYSFDRVMQSIHKLSPSR